MKKRILLGASILMFIGCGSKKATDGTTSTAEDSSSSGLAASAVGGAIASSDSSGSLAFNQGPNSIWSLLLKSAFAAGSCPKIITAAGSGCTQAGNAVDLTYSDCSHGSSLATWAGTLEVSLSSGTAVTCGTFPNTATFANDESIQRQFVSSAHTPGSGSRTTSKGTVVQIDHSTANLGNFDNQTIGTLFNSGYGSVVTFNGSGGRKSVQVKQRLYVTNGFDHSVDGTITISETGTTRAASGTVTVYHNKAKVIGTSTFTNVTYNDTSCTPVSGTITTAFSAGVNVAATLIGGAMVGKSESLTFNGDGTGTYIDTSGASSTVAITHCY